MEVSASGNKKSRLSNDHVLAVKLAAAGRWPEIISASCGMSIELLDGRHHPCPRCGGVDRFRALNDFLQTGAVFCNGCFAEKNGDGISAVRHFRGVDFGEAVTLISDFVGVAKVEVGRRNTRQQSAKADPKILDSAYRIVLQHSPISDQHRAQLRDRGLSDADIDRNGYGTMGPAKQRGLAATEIRETVSEWKTVPGVLVKKLGIAGPEGLLVPVRNLAGQIVALKIRRDKEEGSGSKYIYLSSRTKNDDGASPGAPVHFPLETPCTAKVLRCTEGELKADVAFLLSGVPTISIAGVRQWKSALKAAKQLGVSVLRLAFDADATTNRDVGSSLAAAAGAVVAMGLQLEIERWSIDLGKGIDDLLVAGNQPELLKGDAALTFTKETVAVSASGEQELTGGSNQTIYAEAAIGIEEGCELHLRVSGKISKVSREVTARCSEAQITDTINTSSAAARKRLWRLLSGKTNFSAETIEQVADVRIVELAEQADKLQNEQQQAAGHEEEEKNQATLAVELLEDAGLFHTSSHESFAIVTNQDHGHQETWAIRSSMFRRYLGGLFYKEYGKPLNSEALASAVNALDAKASHCADECPIAVRIADSDGKIYLDLCNSQWQIVEITEYGWRVIEAAESPVRFRRSKGALPLPIPRQGGSIQSLRTLFNSDDESFPLIVAWLIAALRPGIQYPILTLFAEQGTGKSTTSRMIRGLIDPNESPLRSEPRDERDLMIAARNSLILAFDNLSYVSPWMSDAMCRLSTGGGFATRTLYENDEETIFNATRPSLITSIEDIATKSDMLDRAIIIRLPAIDETRRRPESELWFEYEAARPRLLGALLNAVVCGLQNFADVKLSRLPRMADFAKWVVACEPALGWNPGEFLLQYNANRGEANELAMEATPVAKHLLEQIEANPDWIGTSGELLAALNQRAGYTGDSKTRPPKGWPAVPRVLSNQLKRLAPNFRAVGWNIEQYRGGRNSSKLIRFVSTGNNADGATAATAEENYSASGEQETVYNRSQASSSLRPPATDGNGFATAAGEFATDRNVLRPQNSLKSSDSSRNSHSAVATDAPVAKSATLPGSGAVHCEFQEEGVA